MATATPLRLCLRATARLPVRRALSTTPPRRAGAEGAPDDESKGIPTYVEGLQSILRSKKLGKDERQQFEALLKDLSENPGKAEAYERAYGINSNMSRVPYNPGIAELARPGKARRGAFWNDGEPDTDLITNEIGEDEWEEDDILSMAHDKLEEHREYRQYARIAVWEMPLLAKLAKPFQPPAQDEVLRFRYTTYMGEFHPADRKVVVEFCPADLKDLTDAQRLKLKKLAGARYNPEKDVIKMSCERYEHQAQNKRYLGDLVQQMITTAKDPTDMFEDVPLDTRHHRVKAKPKFPVEWRLTPERKAELDALRKQTYDARDLPIPAVRAEQLEAPEGAQSHQVAQPVHVRPQLRR